MEKIWAPWRIEYIKQPKDQGCFICDMIKAPESEDKKNLLLYRGKKAIVLLNKYPYITGHLMIAPLKHCPNLADLSEEEGREIWNLTTKAIELLKVTIHPQGFNVGINLGKVAGAGLRTHVHVHIVPRWDGDTNFMTVVANTRVLSQALEETYEELMKKITILYADKK